MIKETKIITNLKELKNKTYEEIIISVFLALGINFLVLGISNKVNINNSFFTIGLITTLLVFFTLIISKYKSLNRKVRLNGFFIYDKINKNIVKIPEYKISIDMVRYLSSAFSENEALKKLWNKNDINNINIVGEGKDEQLIVSDNESTSLLLELIEYCILENLSTFINDYFNSLDKSEKKIKTYYREDVPDIILKNRFLKLFSEPMKNRMGFAAEDELATTDNEEKREIGRTIMAYGANNTIYKMFDLTLPINSKINKIDKNTLIINMNGFSMKISYLYRGFGTVVDNAFYAHYLKIDRDFKHYSDYKFNINIDVNFKLWSLFYIRNWKYYEWIDMFVNSLTHYLDKDTFYQDINWKLCKTLIKYTDKNISL